MRNIILGLSFLLLWAPWSNGQSGHFSMFYNAPIHLNPALTGNHECLIRVGTSYKDQWRTVSKPYKTFNAFADANISPRKIRSNAFGIGIQVFGDRSGTGNLATNDLRIALAYHKSLMKNDRLVVSLGLSSALVNHALKPELLTFESQWTGNGFDQGLSSNEPFSKTSLWFYDMSAGFYVAYSPSARLSAGLGSSLQHLTRPLYDFLGGINHLNMKYCIHANLNAQLSKGTAFTSRLYFTRQDQIQEWIAGANLTLNANKTPFFLGMWYRFGRDLIPLAGIDLAGFQVMMSYDFNVSKYKIATQSLGGFEIAITKNLFCNYSSKKVHNPYNQRYDCPKF